MRVGGADREEFPIQTRFLIAYALIFLMIGAAVATIMYLRHNSQAKQDARRRQRERAWREERLADEPPQG